MRAASRQFCGALTTMLAAGGLAVLASTALAGDAAAQVPPSPVALEVFTPPQAVTGSDGEQHLVYELKITNTSPVGAVLDGVAVFDPDTRRGYAGFEGTSLGERLRIPDVPLGQTSIPAGAWGAFFVHVAVPPGVPLPRRVSHVVTTNPATSPYRADTLGGDAPVSTAPPIVLGPPLRGSGYIAGDGCCDAPRHVQALLPVDGGWWNAQRFAIDWEQLDGQNRLWVPQPGREKTPLVTDFHIYGKDILAVADGTVVAVVKDLPDQPPLKMPSGLPVEEADGNHVILDLGNGVFVLYAHMAPGTVAVDLNQRVGKGQLLGKVGNSGNTSAPHLHFQAMDRPSALAANGLPYGFERFRITGFDPGGSDDFQAAEDNGTPATVTPVRPPSEHAKQLPLNVTVVDWLN